MPARSNDFQRLIYALQTHLSSSPTAKITESKFLPDKDTQSPVEVDIVVEEIVGGFPIVIGIECTAKKRPATIEWYRLIIEKHRSLPISRTVLVSKSGFTQEVREKSKKNNITLLTLNQVDNFPWKELFEKIKKSSVVNVYFSLASFSIFTNDVNSEKAIKNITANCVFYSGDSHYELGHLITQTAQQSGITRKIMENIGEISKKTNHFSFSFVPPEGSFIKNINNESIAVAKISATMTFTHSSEQVKFDAYSYNDKTVAAGKFKDNIFTPNSENEVIATLSQDQSGKFGVQFVSSTNEKIDLQPINHDKFKT